MEDNALDDQSRKTIHALTDGKTTLECSEENKTEYMVRTAYEEQYGIGNITGGFKKVADNAW